MADEQLTKLIVAVAEVNTTTKEMKAVLLGNGQQGKIADIEDDVRDLHRVKWIGLGVAITLGSGVGATLLGWVK